ncbi:MAG TPA: pyruvate kinase [Victivallales bacterium]|nr:pyruvate kinase [Victivallales bacterium]
MLKSVFTLGPSSTDENIIIKLLHATDKFRLNSSHMNENDLNDFLVKLSMIFDKTGKKIPVVIDLQGSKMRIGQYPPVNSIPEKFILINSEKTNSTYEIPVPHDQFFNSIEIDDVISLNDAKIQIQISKIDNNRAEAVTLVNGPLSSNKGINRQKHPILFEELTRKDQKIITVSNKYDFTEFAFSFAYNGQEADKIRAQTNKRIIAKIERQEALQNLKSIDSSFDEIWLCRGDLGAQAGILNLGHLQDVFISQIKHLNNECFLAGQVLEHMTYFEEPTRTEIVHLYDIEKAGFKGFVLSDETAIGKNPCSIAEFLSKYRSAGNKK